MASRPRILHLIKSLGLGGAEMLLPETLAHHDRKNFDFSYAFFLPWKDQLKGPLEKLDATVHCFRASTGLGMIFKTFSVWRWLKSEKIDLIHSHLPLAGVVSRLAGKFAGIPVVYTEHNKQERYHFVTRRLNLLTLGWNDVTIAVSADVAASIRKFKGPDFPVHVILNGVNTEKFSRHAFDRSVRVLLGIPENALVIGTVAVFRTQKRLDRWIRLATAIHARNTHVHFVLVGDGPLMNEVKTQALALGSHVHFPGRLAEVRPWYASMDIYLITSEFEGLPVALLEAMSMELPVVTTNAGGIGEVIEDGVDGFCKSADRIDDLLPCLDLLIGNAGLRREMGAKARKKAEEKFSIRRMVNDLEDVYKKVTA